MSEIEEFERMESMMDSSFNKGDKEKKALNKEDRIYFSAYFKDLCDLVDDGGKVKFLMKDGSLLDKIRIDDKDFVPPYQDDLDYILPDATHVIEVSKKHQIDIVTTDTADSVQPTGCSECNKLYKELREYHSKISELPNDLYYDLLSLFDYHTYLIDKFNFSPIIYFFADKERGKTRTAKGLIYIARRGIMTETLREANLIRWSRDVRATLLFDVKNFARKLETSQAEDLVYGRAERGVVASRVLFPEKGAFKDTVRFEVFGPTIVTSNKMVDDVGLSRMIIIEMKPSEKIFRFEPTKEAGKELREELTGMRLAHMNQDFIKCEKEETGRIEDMLIGYKSMILTLYPKLIDKYYLIKKLAKQQKMENALDSFEAQIMMIVIKCGEQVETGSLTLTFDLICSMYNEGKPEKWHLSPQSLSKTLRGIGFTSKRNSAGDKRGIFYDVELINRLTKLYGLENEGVAARTPSVVSEDNGKSGVDDKTIQEIFGT